MRGKAFSNSARKRSRVGECVSSTRNARPAPPSAGQSWRSSARYIFKRCAIASSCRFANKSLRARRIVKIENGGLREGVGRAAARRMQRIAFDLDRATIDSRRHQRQWLRCDAASQSHNRELSGDRPLDALRERNQMRFGTATTVQAETRQRHRRTHQFQKAAPRPFVAVQFRAHRPEIRVPAIREIPAYRSIRRGCASIASRSAGSGGCWKMRFIDGTPGSSAAAEYSSAPSTSGRSRLRELLFLREIFAQHPSAARISRRTPPVSRPPVSNRD